MKKKCLSALLTLACVCAMATGYGAASAEDSAGKDQTQIQTETAGEEGDEAEKRSEPYTADDITDEMMEDLYASMKESVTTEYLEPNDINPADFAWPSDTEPDGLYPNWTYFYDVLFPTFASSMEHEWLEFKFPEESMYTTSPNKEILEAAFTGVMSFLEDHEPYEEEFFTSIYEMLEEDHSLIISNVTFNE